MLPKMQKYMNDVKPEAVYFAVAGGQRTVYLVVNLESEDKLPEIVEPLWLDWEADVSFLPVMTPEGLEKAGGEIQLLLAKEWCVPRLCGSTIPRSSRKARKGN